MLIWGPIEAKYIDPVAVEKLNAPSARALLSELADRIESVGEFTKETVEKELRSLAAERGVKAGLIIHAARAALTAQSIGPPIFDVFEIMGRERCVRRLRSPIC